MENRKLELVRSILEVDNEADLKALEAAVEAVKESARAPLIIGIALGDPGFEATLPRRCVIPTTSSTMNTCPSPPLNAVPPTGEGLRFRLVSLALMLVTLGLSGSAVAQTPCEDGVAGQYPCEGLDLMCVRSFEELGGVPPGNGNDCWGWTHDGREFALRTQ